MLEEKAQRKRCNQVLKSLLQAEFLRVSGHHVGSAERWQFVSQLVAQLVVFFIEGIVTQSHQVEEKSFRKVPNTRK